MTVVVVGAGIAGLACARELVDAGVPARVVERHETVGGRLASEFLGGRWTDTGAAYLTADDPAFVGRLRTWRIDGLARPWTDTFRGQHGPPDVDPAANRAEPGLRRRRDGRQQQDHREARHGAKPQTHVRTSTTVARQEGWRS